MGTAPEFQATDEEVAEIDALAKSRSVLHWPALIRTINRMKAAEERCSELSDHLDRALRHVERERHLRERLAQLRHAVKRAITDDETLARSEPSS